MTFPVVTICGSMKLYPQMLEVAATMTEEGAIVLMPFAVKKPATGEALDAMHRAKIDLSDRIVVVIRDNYIGRSTRSEIEYAARTGQAITYWELDPAPQNTSERSR